MYLKPDEKGTPFGRSLLVQAIIASTPSPPPPLSRAKAAHRLQLFSYQKYRMP